MKWHRDTSYHNSRHYDDDAPRGASVSQLRLTIAWLINATRRGPEGVFGRGWSRPPDRPSSHPSAQ